MTSPVHAECHAPGCNRDAMTATRCGCGFTAALLRDEARVDSANRGRGGRERYAVEVPGGQVRDAAPAERHLTR